MGTVHDDIVEMYDGIRNEVIRQLREFDEMLQRENESFYNAVLEDIHRYQKTGTLKATFTNSNGQSNPTNLIKNCSVVLENIIISSKENESENVKNTPTKSTRISKKKPLEEMSINNQLSDNENSTIRSIKEERITNKFNNISTTSQNSVRELQIKLEMPPPSRPPIKQNKRKKPTQSTHNTKTSIQIKTELIKETNRGKQTSTTTTATINSRDSDVKVQNDQIEVINLDDTDENLEKARTTRSHLKRGKRKSNEQCNNLNQNERSLEVAGCVTRTKSKLLKNQKSVCSDNNLMDNQTTVNHSESETESDNPKAKKLKIDAESSTASEYEDALQNIEVNKVNTTVVIKKDNDLIIDDKYSQDKPLQVMKISTSISVNPLKNTPQNAKINKVNTTMVIKNGNIPNGSDLITDDEDDLDKPVQEKRIPKAKKIFTPTPVSPVKKYIEAFEKLNSESKSSIPLKVTHGKFKPAVKEHSKHNENKEKEVTNTLTRAKAKENSKCVTPVMNGRVLHTSSASKMTLPQAENDTKLRSQRTIEANQKKENLRHAQAEELRRKREERQLKAQQIREAMKVEKQKALENMERAKLEKQKQLIAENEEKRLKQEALNREAAMKKAMAARKILKNNNQNPAYLKYDAPLLPTGDCYDSDDETNQKPFEPPSWQKSHYLDIYLRNMVFANKYKLTLFGGQPHTPNLQMIFPSIEAYKLKRTSSAIWNRSGLMKLQEMPEEDE